MAERDDELAVLKELLASGLAGRRGCAVISGPVASGKTELLDTFAEHALASDALLLSAVGSPAECEIPLGVISQLFHSAALPSTADPLLRLLDGSPAAAGRHAEPLRQTPSRIVRAVCATLATLAERALVVITVDNLAYVDPASASCLLAVVQRMRLARLVAVFTDCMSVPPADRVFYAELLCQPQCRRVSLEPLSRRGVNQVLAEHLDAVTAEALTEGCLAASGGNPMLVRALLEDYVWGRPARESAAPAQLVVGDVFRQAVFSYLRRTGTAVLQVARHIALFGESQELPMLARLAGVEPEEATHAVQVLNGAGLLTGTRFRHPATRLAVRSSIPPQERSEMHARAAEMLRSEGEPSLSVAAHILAAGSIQAQWVVPVLQQAAEQALTTDDTKLATRCLETALRTCADGRERAAIEADLVSVVCRSNPAAAVEHLPSLTAALRAGHLSGRRAATVIRLLLWHGRPDEAREALERLTDSVRQCLHAPTSTDLRLTLLWLSSTHPSLLAAVPRTARTVQDDGTAQATVAIDPRLQAASVLADVLTNGADEPAVEGAEQVLQSARLDAMTIGAVESALLALAYSDRIDLAATWCDKFLAEAAARHVPMWQAILASIRSMIAIRQGDLGAARQHATAAMAHIPIQGWGVGIGIPLASLVLATTESGQYDEADGQLGVPVPEELFTTRPGLHYLQARGHHHLAVRRPHAAVADFLTCGELMETWGVDVPTLVPWRTSAAEAWTHLDEPEEARRLANEQLARLPPGPSRTRGLSLRVLAGVTGNLSERHRLLTEAVETLEGCGDRLELARALAELSNTHQALGERRRARMLARRAWYIAKECQAHPLCEALGTAKPEAPGDGEPPGRDRASLTRLTGAERRVAALAAHGHTNREIATKLHVTISTVEQHLTHVYRKLKIRQREDLPMVVSTTLCTLAPLSSACNH